MLALGTMLTPYGFALACVAVLAILFLRSQSDRDDSWGRPGW